MEVLLTAERRKLRVALGGGVEEAVPPGDHHDGPWESVIRISGGLSHGGVDFSGCRERHGGRRESGDKPPPAAFIPESRPTTADVHISRK